MSLFRHPHLIRGVVHTSQGSFSISRGLVDVPDELGESFGWLRLELEDQRFAPIEPTNPQVQQIAPRGRHPLD